jgi:hypothetical protein
MKHLDRVRDQVYRRRMAQTLETHLVAAYIVSRRVTFAGAPVTLVKLAQMWQLPIEAGQPFLGAEVLTRVAKYLRMTLPDLMAAVRKMPLPEPVPSTPPATLEVTTIKIEAQPVTVTLPPPAAVPPTPEPTQVIPRAQLDELRAASRSATPEPPERDSAPEIVISFDEDDLTPNEPEMSASSVSESAERVEAATTETSATPVKKSRSRKSKKAR